MKFEAVVREIQSDVMYGTLDSRRRETVTYTVTLDTDDGGSMSLRNVDKALAVRLMEAKTIQINLEAT